MSDIIFIKQFVAEKKLDIPLSILECFKFEYNIGAKNVAVIDDFFIPKDYRRKGIGTQLYTYWESLLPKHIQVVGVFAGDPIGEGNTDQFWMKSGFKYMYTTTYLDELDYISRHSMFKGVNGFETPETEYISLDSDD